MTNIVDFPKSKIVRDVAPNVEEIVKAREKSVENFAEGAISDIVDSIYSEIENNGIETETDNFTKDFSFMVEGLRSCIYRSLNLEHHLHAFLDNYVNLKKMTDGESFVGLKFDDDTELEIEDTLDSSNETVDS
jgi:hypothetical protein